MKKIIITFLFGLITSTSIAQALHCDSLTTPNSTIQLIPMQDSTLFSYSNIASDSVFFSQSYYVIQWVSMNDHSVVDTIIRTIQWSSTGGALPTYVYPSQTYKLDITYNVASVPPNYSLQCYYNIHEPSFGGTCQIPFTLNFGTTVSVDDRNIENIRVYPNPVEDYVMVYLPQGESEILIFDLSGKVILLDQSKKTENHLNLSDINEGVYIMRIRNLKNGKTTIKKIIKL